MIYGVEQQIVVVLCFLSRVLVQICKTQAFQKMNPAEFELQERVSDAVQVSGDNTKYIQ